MDPVYIVIFVLTVLFIVLLLGLGSFFNLKYQKNNLDKLWFNLTVKIQYYLDNVPYLLESYRMLHPEDKESYDKVVALKEQVMKSKKTANSLEHSFHNLFQEINLVFALKNKDPKLAHDLRFMESYSEFQKILYDLQDFIKDFNEVSVPYNHLIQRKSVRLFSRFVQFHEFPCFKI